MKPKTETDKYKERIQRWWSRTARQKSVENELQLQEEMKRDRERLFSVCRERRDGAELADTIVRLVENAFAFAHYAGIRRGYKIGVEVGKGSSEEKIIQIISKKLDATPNEISEMIDAYNSRFDDLKDSRRVHIIWPELAKKVSRWSVIAHLPKVKNYLVRARTRAQQVYRIRGWKQIMDTHEKNRR